MRLSASLDFAAAGDDWAARDETAADAPRLAQRMDAAAFQVFYAKTAPGLRAYIRRASGNEALADDILQEAFLRFLRADLLPFNDARFTPVTPADAPLKAYLYKIAPASGTKLSRRTCASARSAAACRMRRAGCRRWRQRRGCQRNRKTTCQTRRFCGCGLNCPRDRRPPNACRRCCNGWRLRASWRLARA